MSQKPRKRSQARKVSSGAGSQEGVSDYDYEDEDDGSAQYIDEGVSKDYPPRRQSRKGGYDGRGGSYRSSRSAYVAPKRDIFPYIMGGIIGSLVVGLMLVIFLLTNRSGGTNPGVISDSTIPTPITSSGTQAPEAGTDAPRITMDEFKKLYDDPAKRPLIIDVRAKTAYDQGHIKGSVSFPEAEADARVAELPKDKLIVAYCQ